ncbi:MAG: hypothetical protein ACK43M_02430 [Allorhizobium sp.]
MNIMINCFAGWVEAGVSRHSCYMETKSFAFFWEFGQRPLFDWKTAATGA